MSVFLLHTFMLSMVICLPSLTNGNKPKRLDRIEDRLDIVEARQDHASIANREDIEGITLRLDDIETVLNSSMDDQTGCRSNLEVKISPETVSKEMQIMRRAFAAEKLRLRQNTSELETIVNDATAEMQTIMDTSDQKVSSTVESMKKALESIQESVNVLIEQSQLDTRINADRLENAFKLFKENVIRELNETKEDNRKANQKMINDLVSKYQLKVQPFLSCLEIYNSGEHQSGAYDIQPAPGKPVLKVYCDMDTDGGGWTVFQRRKDGSVDFYRGWDEYAAGFGDLNGEFWVGNTHLSTMTSQCCHELRVDLEDFEGNAAFAKYSRFQILPEKDNFRLEVSGYSGDAGDSLDYQSGEDFSTKDRENDSSDYNNCAEKCKGAWWYRSCSYSNLNGEYLKGEHAKSFYEGVHWFHWKNTHKYSLKKTDMKFRATN